MSDHRLERIRSVFDRSGIALSLADLDGHDCPLVLSNARFETLTGYRARDCVGRNCRFLQDPDDPVNLDAREDIHAAIARRSTTQVVLRNRRRDGTVFDNLLFLHPVGAGGRYMLGSQFELAAEDRDALSGPGQARAHAGILARELEHIGAVSARLRMQVRRQLAESAAAMVVAWARNG